MMLAHSIAKILLEIKAVQFNINNPFQYTSGLQSPIYCDNRLVISHPKARNTIIDGFLSLIETHALPTELIAGTATAGIPHAAWIADRLQQPMVYIREKAKAHGKNNQIEGHYKIGQKALVVEDLISTGNSAISACQALKAQGVIAEHCLAIFNYQLNASQQAFQEANIKLHTLTTLDTLLDAAIQQGQLIEKQRNEVHCWRNNPKAWTPSIQKAASST
tara:strand:- start:119 stop:775 length:657 start_codon:yes stop_codon:yes gene_type:complete